MHYTRGLKPPFAYKAFQAEDKIGMMLPCNIIVQETAEGTVNVASIDSVVSMQTIENSSLEDIAVQIQRKFKKMIERL